MAIYNFLYRKYKVHVQTYREDDIESDRVLRRAGDSDIDIT